MKILVIDIGGTHVKILATGQLEHREFTSGPTLTPRRMVAGVKRLAKDWKFDAVAIGYPGPVLQNKPVAEPHNLAAGWVGFNFAAAFKRPVKVINDAAMQALGSYKRGTMLFLGLGTGLGTAMIVGGLLEPMELGHLPYKKATYEDYVGLRGLEKFGKKRWRRYVADVVECLKAALGPDDTVLGGGNVKKLKAMPPGTRAGDNANAFLGGFRLWGEAVPTKRPARPKARPAAKKRPPRAAPPKKRLPVKSKPKAKKVVKLAAQTPDLEPQPRAWPAASSEPLFPQGDPSEAPQENQPPTE